MKIIKYLEEAMADPLIAMIILIAFILPALWGLFKFLEWINICDSGKMRNRVAEDE